MFRGIGSLSYNRTEIEMFYRYMSLAQNSSLSEYDRNRLIWFHMTQKLYALGPVPDIVKKTFIKYMQYFEKNIDNIDKEL